MPNKLIIAGLFSLFFCWCLTAQEKNKKKNEIPKEIVIDSVIVLQETINALAPAKAAFYSAVLPGLGQAYNKSYWKIPLNRVADIKSGYNNLLSIYEEAILIDPINLAKAISSLDCWSEQEEEKWQTWDIDKCKNDFHSAMHRIYENISSQKILKENTQEENDKSDSIQEEESESSNVTIGKQNEKKEIMQIIYFNFDDSKLSEISKNVLINLTNVFPLNSTSKIRKETALGTYQLIISVNGTKPRSIEHLYELLNSGEKLSLIMREWSDTDNFLYDYLHINYKARDVIFYDQ